MTTKGQKILLIIFGLLIALVLGEAIFRLGSFLAVLKIGDFNHEEKDAYKILCLGDSTTYGLGASDIDKFSYPMQLQKILETTSPAKKYVVINKGSPGLNSSQLLNRLSKLLAENRPDLVIIMIGINDSWNLEESSILKFYKQGPLDNVLLYFEILLDRIRLYQFFKLLFLSNEVREPESVSFNPDNHAAGFQFHSDDNQKSQALYSALKHNILEMLRIIDNSGVKVFFMKYHTTGWGSPEKAINQIYAHLNVPIVDNKIVFNSAVHEEMNVWGSDGWHPNDLGHLLIAKNIYNTMIMEKVIQGELFNLYDDFNKTKIFLPKVFESNIQNFHDDFIWTKGDGTISNIKYEVKPNDNLLVLNTFGWHPFKKDLLKLKLQVTINGHNLNFDHQDDNSYHFILDKKINFITEVQIFSSTFIPEKLGMNNDTRELGIDIASIEIK